LEDGIITKHGIPPEFRKLHKEMKETRESKDFKMISIIGGRAKIIDMRKKSWIYGDQGNFKDTVRIR